MCPEPTGRRPLLKAAVGGVIALGAAGTATRIVLDHSGDPTADRGGADGALQLSSHGDSGVSALDIQLGDDLLPKVSGHHWRSAHLPTSTHSMVAFTWKESAKTPHIHIKSRINGTWQNWERLPVLHDLPDLGSDEYTGVIGTELVWIGDADGIQIHVTGHRPKDLTLVLLHPGRQAVDATVDRLGSSPRAVAPRMGVPVPSPKLLSRKEWGADESWRDGGPRYNDTIQQVHVHHTVNSNTYAQADVPGLIRGMYRYHTHNLGWSDIGYNFLVDRFGSIWVGRYGGVGKPVRGAHTLGFNATSTGISVIGNFDLVAPTQATLNGIAAVAAWKLDHYRRQPNGVARVLSEGSDKYRASQVVTLPVIDGHRDTNDTACPGQHLYDALPSIRTKTKALMDRYHSVETVVTITEPARITGTPALGKTLTADTGTFTPADATVTISWMRNDVAIPDATGASYACTPQDVGTHVKVRVDLTKPGVQPATQVAETDGLVTAPASLNVVTKGRRGKAIVHVEVTAPQGVSAAPTGKVVVVMHKRTQTLTLTDGVAVGRFGRSAPYKAGDYLVTVRYTGSPSFTEATASASVSVL